ncbi:hypothetical protein DERP_007023 [Dermatophagoides pteronyssinus]|uniref:Uncharacterized protein n=1 Tax=Dermatophagoides pteronyssinus TaxID=6956 RepID=A0ABQ8JTY0_DERPT|nr:hypothetical protein DERP_007023 [Dermatophagoides pteronyssinus]
METTYQVNTTVIRIEQFLENSFLTLTFLQEHYYHDLTIKKEEEKSLLSFLIHNNNNNYHW